MTKFLVVIALCLTLQPAFATTDTLRLQISPLGTSNRWEEFHYLIHLPENSAGKALCSGWQYPVVQWLSENWPQRDSCRVMGRERVLIETWGGPKYPLPYVGEYIGYVYLFDSKTKTSEQG